MKPLLCLAMIVKDEAKSIRATIESVRRVVDRFAIVDTGSIDGTQNIVREEAGANALFAAAFSNFAETRNVSLRCAFPADFALVLSGDETLADANELRAFCEARRNDPDGAYNLPIDYGPIRFDSTRLVRLPAGVEGRWRYVSESGVHEALVSPEGSRATIRAPGRIVHDSSADPERKHSRLYRDLEMLRKRLREMPTDTRALFYLAQTLEDLGLRAQAYETYAKRVDLGRGLGYGNREEVYESLFRMARNARLLGKPWPEAQQLYLDAHTEDPRRAEPLFEIAQAWASLGNHALAWLFASRGAEISYPESSQLFLYPDVYRYKLAELAARSGLFVGEFEAGKRYAQKALEAVPESDTLKELVASYQRETG